MISNGLSYQLACLAIFLSGHRQRLSATIFGVLWSMSDLAHWLSKQLSVVLTVFQCHSSMKQFKGLFCFISVTRLLTPALSFTNSDRVVFFKLYCLMITTIELYIPFIPVLMTLVAFQGHSFIRKSNCIVAFSNFN